MLVIVIVAALLGGASVEQVHYNTCEKLKFKGEACALEKQLCELTPGGAECGGK